MKSSVEDSLAKTSSGNTPIIVNPTKMSTDKAVMKNSLKNNYEVLYVTHPVVRSVE